MKQMKQSCMIFKDFCIHDSILIQMNIIGNDLRGYNLTIDIVLPFDFFSPEYFTSVFKYLLRHLYLHLHSYAQLIRYLIRLFISLHLKVRFELRPRIIGSCLNLPNVIKLDSVQKHLDYTGAGMLLHDSFIRFRIDLVLHLCSRWQG